MHRKLNLCFNQKGDISTPEGTSLKLVDKFTYLGSSVSSTEKDIDTRLTMAWTAIDRLSIIWKSNLTNKMKRSFFQAAVVSILLYGCTSWTLTKRLEKKLYGNYTRMLRAILNRSWQQYPTRRQLYGHLPPITKTIQARRTRHAGYCWRSKDEIVSDVLLWTPAYGQSKVGRPARTFIQQLCDDTVCNPKTCRRRWMIGRGGERRSGIFVLAARHDDDEAMRYQVPFLKSLVWRDLRLNPGLIGQHSTHWDNTYKLLIFHRKTWNYITFCCPFNSIYILETICE